MKKPELSNEDMDEAKSLTLIAAAVAHQFGGKEVAIICAERGDGRPIMTAGYGVKGSKGMRALLQKVLDGTTSDKAVHIGDKSEPDA